MEFNEVHDVNGEAFREAMGIYLEAIPAAERQKVSVIEERVTAGKEHLLIGKKGGKVACMALIYPLQGSDFALIDYLAVRKVYRQKGLGTQLIRHIQDTYEAKGRRLIGEVEDPKQGGDLESRACRVAFYRRNGARVLKSVPYQLPPLQENQPTPMILITFTKSREAKMDGEEVKKLMRQIYAELYGRDTTDPLLNTFINAVPAKVILE